MSVPVKVTYHPALGGGGRIVLSTERGHTTLQGGYEEWQAQQLAHLLDAEYKVWGSE